MAKTKIKIILFITERFLKSHKSHKYFLRFKKYVFSLQLLDFIAQPWVRLSRLSRQGMYYSNMCICVCMCLPMHETAQTQATSDSCTKQTYMHAKSQVDCV